MRTRTIALESVTGYIRGTDSYRDLAAIEVDTDLSALTISPGVYTRQTAKPVMSLGFSSNPHLRVFRM